MTHILKQNKGAHLSLQQGKKFLHKAMSLAQAVWTLYLLAKKCSSPKSYSYVTKMGVERLHMRQHFPASFPLLNIEKKELCWLHWLCYSFYLHQEFCNYTFREMFYNCPTLLSHLLSGHKLFLPLL